MTELERLSGAEREAPEHLLRALRVIDPTAELVYLGHGTWMLGRVVAGDARIERAGRTLLKSCAQATKGRSAKGLRPEDYRRYRMGHLRRLGFQPTAEYQVQGEPTAAIVRDQEVMDFLWRTTSDDERSRMNDAEYVKRKADAHADLTDEARGRDAYRYLFTRNHAMKRLDDPTRNRVRSGWTSHQRVA